MTWLDSSILSTRRPAYTHNCCYAALHLDQSTAASPRVSDSQAAEVVPIAGHVRLDQATHLVIRKGDCATLFSDARLDLERHDLDTVATRVWVAVGAGRTVDEVIAALPDLSVHVVHEILGQLVGAHLVQVGRSSETA